MDKTEKLDVYEIVRDRIIAQLESGIIPWRQPWASSAPINAISKRPYSGINLFLLPQDYSDNRWLTFKQAQERGGTVRKGEKSSIVVFWKILKVDDEKHEGQKKTIPLLRYYRVFNVEQCDNLKIAEQAPQNGVEPVDVAERIIANMPNAPRITHSGDRAFYRPSTDSITLPTKKSFSSTEGYYSTAFHELTHSTGHVSRLGRHEDSNMMFGCSDYSKEELVAEFGAAYLCAHAGISNAQSEGQSAAYIASWLKALRAADKRELISAASKAQKAAQYVLGAHSGEEEVAN